MANEFLRRTPTSTGNRKVFTWSGWIKIQGNSVGVLFASDDGSNQSVIRFPRTGDTIQVGYWNGSGYTWDVRSSQLIRDCGSWYHLAVAVDTTSSTSSDRVKIYLNGNLITNLGTASYPSINFETEVGKLQGHGIGAMVGGSNLDELEAEISDIFFIDGQALTPDVFGFYKVGKGYISAGSAQATDFRPGQWVPKTPRVIKTAINNNGGFGVNGFYLPMNDSNNFGADFHCPPNSIIKLKGEDLPQPRNGAPTTSDAYVSQLREDPYAANLVLAVPGISGGQDSGYGDYSADVKGSGSNRTSTRQNVSIATTAGYYGSAISTVDASDYLYYDLDGTDYGTNDFTFECWFYATSEPSEWGILMKHATNASWANGITLNSKYSTTRTFAIYTHNGSANFVTASSTVWELNQWHHVVAERYNNTLTLYVNGVAHAVRDVTGHNYSVAGTPAASAQYGLSVGAQSDGNYQSNGYFNDVRVYKGVAKYKGGFDVPRPYTPVGIATWRAVPDTTANNFATWNPLDAKDASSISNGNLSTGNFGANKGIRATVGVSTGKWYWEWREENATPNNHHGIWAVNSEMSNYYVGQTADSWGIYVINGNKRNNASFDAYGSAFSQGDIAMCALDKTNGKIWWGKNGTWFASGNPTTGSNEAFNNVNTVDVVSPTQIQYRNCSYNFGQNPTFSGNTTAGTFTDTNGKGLFKYQPPSGFLALCEDNLPTPAISDPGKYFKTVLYTGDGNSGRSITGIGFQPDFVWIKSRDSITGNNILVDSVRGSMKTLFSEQTLAEYTDRGVYSFNADGFTTGPNNGDYSLSGANYVAWCWRAGAGTTSTNTDGSITSVVSVNQDAGFSIVSYTGTAASNATVGHGLGKAPAFIINKNRSNVSSWVIQHNSLGWTSGFLGWSTVAATSSTAFSNNTSPTNNVFTVAAYSLGLNQNYVAYCWAEIEGFSKFGSYIGNGSTDGPFVYCGFKPAWVMIKRTDSTQNWPIIDSSRDSVNVANRRLFANLSDIEDQGIPNFVDILSNGFKCRDSNVSYNASGGTYIFAAFAESPFVYSNSK